MKRAFYFMVMNGLYAAVMIQALAGHAGFRRVFLFWLWLGFFLQAAVSFNPVTPAILKKVGYPINSVLFHLIGFSFIAALVWNGWWVSAVVSVFVELMQAADYCQDEKKVA